MSDLELSSHIYSYMKEDNFKQSALITNGALITNVPGKHGSEPS